MGGDVAVGIGDGVRAGTLAVGSGDAGGGLDEFGPTKGLALPLQAFTVRNEASDISPKKKRRIIHPRDGQASIEFMKR